MNVFAGTYAGDSNVDGDGNTFLGYVSGKLNQGNDNVFVGNHSGYVNTSGAANSFVGACVETAGVLKAVCGAWVDMNCWELLVTVLTSCSEMDWELRKSQKPIVIKIAPASPLGRTADDGNLCFITRCLLRFPAVCG